MNLIGILFCTVLLALIVKAVFETIWGIGLIIFVICCQLVAWTLYGFAEILQTIRHLRKTSNW